MSDIADIPITAGEPPAGPESVRMQLSTLAAAPERALALLADPAAGRFDAVVWLSVHLAAFRRSVQPVARKHQDVAMALRSLRRGVNDVERQLRRREQVHGGDMLADTTDHLRERDVLSEAIRRQIEREARVISQLVDRLTVPEAQALRLAYHRALRRAPTRPHPYTPHGRHLSGLFFHVNGTRDRLMNSLDSRPVPSPHDEHPAHGRIFHRSPVPDSATDELPES